MSAPSVSLTLTAEPTEDELATIGGELSRFNEANVGPSNRQALAVLLRNGDGAIVGGLSGYTAWGWLYVQWLWVGEPLQGQGWARHMLDEAEQEARNRGCHGAYIDTFNPVALGVYQRQGYRPFGNLPDFPLGRTRTFLQKPL